MSQSESNKMTAEESEKLKELERAVKDLEQASDEAVKGGGTKIDDATLERAKRAVESYKKYLGNKTPTEEVKGAQTGESGPEKVNVTKSDTGGSNTPVADSPDVAKF